jgi:hypothetical protein
MRRQRGLGLWGGDARAPDGEANGVCDGREDFRRASAVSGDSGFLTHTET